MSSITPQILLRAYAAGTARLGMVSFLSAQDFVAKQSPELQNISLARVPWVGGLTTLFKKLDGANLHLLRVPVSSECGLGSWSPPRRTGSREEAHLNDPNRISDRPHPGVAQADRIYTDAR